MLILSSILQQVTRGAPSKIENVEIPDEERILDNVFNILR